MISRILIALALGYFIAGGSAQAASVEFSVGNVFGYFDEASSEGFQLGKMTAVMQCRFEDGSGAVSASPTREIPIQILDGMKYPQTGFMFPGATLKARVRLAALQSCSYRIVARGTANDTGREVSGEVVLAGSRFNMSGAELDELLSDRGLDVKISQRLRPVRLKLSSGVIVEAK